MTEQTPAARSGSTIAAPVTRADSVAPQQHRHDLDGLRGLAIALVVLFHLWMDRVSGGVDVFLVLSGFFFTGMVLRGGAIGPTLRRTGRRLLPALLVVLAAVLAATVLLRPYTQWGDISAQTLASAFYYQNWYLAGAELDYLAPDPSVSPLQHLWSMAVQGQFYLAMLALIAVWARATGRTPRARAALLLGVLAVAGLSFWYAAAGTDRHQAWTYYDTGARAWELLAGAALAIAAPWITVPRALRGVLGALGLLMVLCCGVLIDGAAHFPGPAALFPVSAALALIVSGMGAQPPAANRLLATPALVRLGGLAYALYLWHWPILIFYLAEYGQEAPGVLGGLSVLGLALVAAYATERWIEAPLRRREPAHPRRRLVRLTSAAAGVGVLACALGWQAVLAANPPHPPAALDPHRYPGATVLTDGVRTAPEPLRPTVFEGQQDAPRPTFDGCITPNREVRACVYGDQDAERTIALVGGSHSEHWLPALEVLATEHRFRILTYLKEGCPLTLVDEPSYALAPFPECREWSGEVLDRLDQQRPDWVFVTATRPRPDRGDAVPPEYLEVWTALSERGLPVLAVRDTPWPRRDGVGYRALDCLAHRGNAYSCGVDRAAALDPENPALEPASAYPMVFPFDLTDALCRPDRCLAAEGNVLVYRDEHHLSASYARTLAPSLGREIGAITAWW
ncbi:acyltransferase family protein [Nocardia sp. NPDC048505]|uniref:acyltransferase family protein n=1 Tax=unclassified Nocardia TaxID=2637762 RepID=UPI0034047AAF